MECSERTDPFGKAAALRAERYPRCAICAVPRGAALASDRTAEAFTNRGDSSGPGPQLSESESAAPRDARRRPAPARR